MRSSDHPKTQQFVGRPAGHEVVAAVAETFDITPQDIHDGHGGGPRMLTAWLSRYERSRHWSRSRPRSVFNSTGYVSDLIARCERELARDVRLRDLADRALMLLRPDALLSGRAEPIHYWPALPPIDCVRDSAPLYA